MLALGAGPTSVERVSLLKKRLQLAIIFGRLVLLDRVDQDPLELHVADTGSGDQLHVGLQRVFQGML